MGKFPVKLFVFLLIILLLSILSPLSFFEGNKLIMGLDSFPPIKSSFRLYEWSHTWSSFMMGADLSSRVVNIPTQILPYFIFEKLGFTFTLSQKLYYIIIFLISGLSMFYLSLTIWNKKYEVAFISSLVYMFNPVVGGYWITLLPEALFTIAATPLLLAVFIKGLSNRNIVFSSIIFSFSTLLYPVVNPPMFLIVIMVLLSFFFYYFLESNDKKRLIKYLFLCVLFSLIINFWWIGVLSRNYLNIFTSIQALSQTENRLVTSSGRSSILNIFRQIGNNYWGFSYYVNTPNNWVGYLYEKNFLLIFSTFLYPIFAFLSLIIFRKNRLISFLGILSLVFIFLAKGVHSPFSAIYDFLMRLPYFSMFRTPADKFPIAIILIFSLLIGNSIWGLQLLLINLKKRFSKIFFSLVVIVLLVSQWYFFTGDAIQRGKGAQPSVLVEIPQYYWDASNWLKSQDHFFRVLNLPGANIPSRWISYKWGFLGVYTFLGEILERPVIDKPPLSDNETLRWQVYSLLGNDDSIPNIYNDLPSNKSIYKILKMINVDYLLVNNDADWENLHYQTASPKVLAKNLIDQQNIRFERSFGNLDFYKVEGPSVPHIFTPKEAISIYGELPIATYSSLDEFNNNQALILNQIPSFANGLFLVPKQVVKFNQNLVKAGQIFQYPFVRSSPNSPAYKIVRLKEKLIEEKTKDPELLLNIKLSTLAKRIAELGTFGYKLNDNERLKIIADYKITFLEVNEILKSLSFDDFNKILDIQNKIQLQRKELLILIKRFKLDNDSGKFQKDINELYEEIFNQLSKTNSISLVDGKLDYFVNIPKSGNYELLLKDESYSSQLDSNKDKKVKAKINGKTIQTVLNSKENWINLGEVFLEAGSSNLNLDFPSTPNLIGEDWQTEGSGDKMEIKESLILDKENNKTYQEILGITGFGLIVIDFDYYIEGGILNLRITNQENTPENLILEEEIFGSTGTKKHYQRILKLDKTSERLWINFSYSSMGDPTKQIKIEEVSAKKIFEPVLLLKNIDSFNNTLVSPIISFKEESPTEYGIKIENSSSPYLLVFSESFDPGWKLSYKNRNIPEERHLKVNGFANAWYILPEDVNGNDDYALTINFWPQKLFRNSIVISVIFVITSAVYVLWICLKRFICKK